jgi:CRP/FNR family cyclic AMP-dependent transcriptional regulator
MDLCNEPDAMSHPEGTQIKVSRQELSRLVGCSREMAGRVLKVLEEQGLLTARGKTMVVYGVRPRLKGKAALMSTQPAAASPLAMRSRKATTADDEDEDEDEE